MTDKGFEKLIRAAKKVLTRSVKSLPGMGGRDSLKLYEIAETLDGLAPKYRYRQASFFKDWFKSPIVRANLCDLQDLLAQYYAQRGWTFKPAAPRERSLTDAFRGI